MSDLKLFQIRGAKAAELQGRAATLEKSLQALIERNLETLLGVRFLKSEYSTGKKHGGRIDTLGLDENGSPVIIEYKRSLNENVINQGLFYLDWLMDHKAEFQLLVMEVLDKKTTESIEWSAPRLLCIAGDFTRYDEHAVKQMNRNIELIRYKRFDENLLLLELVNAASVTPTLEPPGGGPKPRRGRPRTVGQRIETLEGPLLDLYEQLRADLIELGDDVQEKTLKHYVAFKRLKNFACVEVHPHRGKLTLYVKVDPKSVKIEKGFTRDVSSIGHFGTGDLEITLKNRDDLKRAQPLILDSYEAS